VIELDAPAYQGKECACDTYHGRGRHGRTARGRADRGHGRAGIHPPEHDRRHPPVLGDRRTLGIDGEGAAALPAVKGYDDATGVGSPARYIQSFMLR